MYVRATLLEVDTLRTSVDDALQVFEAEVLPHLRQQPGYEGVMVMATPDGKGLLLTFWSNEAEASADGESGFYADTLARYVTLFRAPPDRQRYEVLFSEDRTAAAR
jgi:hypothetical protein